MTGMNSVPFLEMTNIKTFLLYCCSQISWEEICLTEFQRLSARVSKVIGEVMANGLYSNKRYMRWTTLCIGFKLGAVY